MAPTDKIGIWGLPTSTLDWCEENYVITPYIAEFWNTISSIAMIFPPLISAYHHWKMGLELRNVILSIFLFTVGIGSWMFHMTLKYEMQILDELPMIYGTCAVIYVIHNQNKGPQFYNITQATILILYSIFSTYLYMVLKNPLLYQFFYGMLVFILIFHCYHACKRQPEITLHVLVAFSMYLIGFILWNIDNTFCSTLRHRRQNTMSPIVKHGTQLHAWWHLFAGTASYLQIIYTSYARTLHLKRRSSIKLAGFCIPYLEVSKSIQ